MNDIFDYGIAQRASVDTEIIIAQINQSPESLSQPQSDSLIDSGSENLIDFGLVILAVAVVITIGIINQQLNKAILFSLALSAFLIIILWSI
ncbi:MAG: hypothetical protein AAFV71_01750 [Cyanobacteria bacterium J06633_8]